MTVGKDVSTLFFPVLKCVETPSLELKKLVYLYIINYAKSQPDVAVLAVNTFRKDIRDKSNPLIRGLAVRTMGCIGIESIFDYLADPLKDAMDDEDPYVRKTAAVCVAKLAAINPDRIESLDFVDRIKAMLHDGNAMVVSNTIASLTDMGESLGRLVQVTDTLAKQLLNALLESSEWGRVYILDFLAGGQVPSQRPEDIEEYI